MSLCISPDKSYRQEGRPLQWFAAACEPIAWEHSGIDRTDSALFGYCVGNDLVAPRAVARRTEGYLATKVW